MGGLFTTLVLLAILVALFYLFLVWNFNYWRKRGIKTAKSYPLVGSFPSLFTQKRNMAYDIDELYYKYKKTENFIGVINCRTPQLLILNPDLVHKVVVNDFRNFHDNEFSKFVDSRTDKIFINNPFILTGEKWKAVRAEVTPGLTASRVSAGYPITLEVCKRLVDYIKRQSKMATKDGLDGKQLAICFTTEVVSDTVLGISARSFTDDPTPIVKVIQSAFDQSWGFIIFTALANLWEPIRKIYSVPLFDMKTQDFFMDLFVNALNLRRKMPDANERVDFLNYIMQLQDKKNLTTAELTSHTMTFLTDGFETTSLVLSHTLLMLARYPATQERLRKEIGTENLSFEKLNELPYLEACIHESLRIMPALLSARKLCTQPTVLENKDGVKIQLKPGDVVILPVFSLHRDPDYYEKPEEFIPERYLEENGGGLRQYRDKGLYLGFGDGPRICPGMRFSLTQIKAAVVAILRNFNVKVNPKTRKDNRLHDTYFMALLHGGIYLDFEERA